MAKQEKITPKCYKCGRPLHPLMLKFGNAIATKVKNEDGVEETKMMCQVCADAE